MTDPTRGESQEVIEAQANINRINADTCTWSDDGEGNYDTECQQCFSMIDGTPAQNNMKYCAYCGKKIFEVPFTVEEIEDDEND